MGLKKYIQKYKSYEATELARRAEKKKKLKAYIDLKKKKNVIVKKLKKFDPKRYSKSIGNPYGVKFPKVKKKTKNKRKRKKIKTVIVYR